MGSEFGFSRRMRAEFHWPAERPEQAALDSVLDALAPAFEREGTAMIEGERSGALLVITEDAGSSTAVQFWRDALEIGLSVASPGAFPWCLANAPCGALARRFRVTGPNITWLANFNEDGRAFEAPAAWLVEYFYEARVEPGFAEAWLVALRFGPPTGRAMVWHLVAESAAADDDRSVDVIREGDALAGSLEREWVSYAGNPASAGKS